jgi:hypothetical protein
VRALVAASVAVLAGCADDVKCHTPSSWPPCANATAEPGASGTPPTITSLVVPTCAYTSDPQVAGPLMYMDPDGDAQTVKVSLYVGPRQSESELTLPPKGTSVPLTIAIPMAMEGSYDVRVKVTDRQGGQSAPVCNTVTIFR